MGKLNCKKPSDVYINLFSIYDTNMLPGMILPVSILFSNPDASELSVCHNVNPTLLRRAVLLSICCLCYLNLTLLFEFITRASAEESNINPIRTGLFESM